MEISDERLKEIINHHLPFNTEVEAMARELLERRKADRDREIDLRGFSAETIAEFKKPAPSEVSNG